MLASLHTRDSPNPRTSRKLKQTGFIISTHVAGTWKSEEITKGLSVWMGMTVAKSHIAVYTIRLVWFNQRREHLGAARQRSATCSVLLYMLSQQEKKQNKQKKNSWNCRAAVESEPLQVLHIQMWLQFVKAVNSSHTCMHTQNLSDLYLYRRLCPIMGRAMALCHYSHL